MIIMGAYPDAYLGDVVENQGKLFDFVAQTYPDKDTEDFINTYMVSRTRKCIDEAKAYVNTMDAKELWNYFLNTEKYSLKPGNAMPAGRNQRSGHRRPPGGRSGSVLSCLPGDIGDGRRLSYHSSPGRTGCRRSLPGLAVPTPNSVGRSPSGRRPRRRQRTRSGTDGAPRRLVRHQLLGPGYPWALPSRRAAEEARSLSYCSVDSQSSRRWRGTRPSRR